MAKKAPVIGILMLDCAHSDIPGCAGSNDTFPFKVKRRIIKGATVERMTSGSYELLGPVLAAAKKLQEQGVDAIMGDCGFIAIFQKELQANIGIPVFSSSLLLVPLIARIIPQGKRIGILTYRADKLKEVHFQGAGWSSEEILIAIAGMQDQSAWQALSAPEHSFPCEDLEKQLLDVSRDLVHNHSDLGALLECTVMPPFAHRLRAEIGLPVFDITMIASLVGNSLYREPFRRKPASM